MSISWQAWLDQSVSKANLPFNIQSSPVAIAKRATEFHTVGEYQVPLIGGFTELENWLLSVCVVELQKVSTLFALNKARLIDRCLTELQISKERFQDAQADMLTVMSGGLPESAEVLKWAVENAEDLASLVSTDYVSSERIAQFERCGVIMATRIDPTVDWLEVLLNSPDNLVGALTELIQIESGMFGVIQDEGEPDPKKS
jgi:hypothetical protein